MARLTPRQLRKSGQASVWPIDCNPRARIGSNGGPSLDDETPAHSTPPPAAVLMPMFAPLAKPTQTITIAGAVTITKSGAYTIFQFTTSGSLILSGGSLVSDFLVVGGGGAGGNQGGGGGGDVEYNTSQTFTAGTYGAIVGPGGAANVYGTGGTSTFKSVSAGGGGSGGSEFGANAHNGATPNGSGGGGNGSYNDLRGPGAGDGSGTSGGAGVYNTYQGGGGGGRGGVGGNASSTVGGVGGAGISNSITGAAVIYGAGGGGQGSSAGGAGTADGGGRGSTAGSGATAGTANTGSGSGGGLSGGIAGANGTVIVRFLTSSFTYVPYSPDGVLRTPSNMTSDSAPSPFVASANSEYNSSYGAWCCFDGNSSTSWATNAGGVPAWISIDLGAAYYCATYKMTSRSDYSATDPNAWQLQGSSDNSTWSTVDSQSGITWTAGQQRTFTPASPNLFRYWRLWITTTVGNGGASLGAWEIRS